MMVDAVRGAFSLRRPIDRTIEKVIDYYAQEETRLAGEVSEYEVTDNIEDCFRKFLDVFGEGVRGGHVTEVGIWVSGFYGSGKSSFTKYLGSALDPSKMVQDAPLLDLLCERFAKNEIPAALKTVAKNHPTAVIFLDLGSEQLAESAATPVSTVLYWKVLEWAGFSKEKKTAQLEFTLDRRGKYEEFKKKYKKRYKNDWHEIHNDPLIAVTRAAEIIPSVLPEEFPTPEGFRNLRFELARDIRDLTGEIIELCRKKTGHENILLLIDEAGQYVAPRGELILNLDGFARNIKELGKGKVWIVATGQQTLTEIVEKAIRNSAELNKLRDRFPISIHLDASDIREITHRRLLDKSEKGHDILSRLFSEHGQAMLNHTRLSGTVLYKGDPDIETFVKLYPFLPQHFDLLLELIRVLARTTGGIGLRSAIRVIQDVLVDKSRVLSGERVKLADKKIGTLACVDDFFDTLRADISKVLPHVVVGVDKAAKIFGQNSFELRVAKAVAALQPVESFPRTAENIAALLYDKLGSGSPADDVREALRKLTTEKECGLIEDPQAGGYVFLSDAVKPIRDERNALVPTSAQCFRAKMEVLKNGTADHVLFRTQPTARLENIKEVKAAVKMERASIIGGSEDIDLKLQFVSSGAWENTREDLLVATNSRIELKNTVVLMIKENDTVDELLPEIVKSDEIIGRVDERSADRDVAQFLRAERQLTERYRERVAALLEKDILDGVFIFRGKPTPARESGETMEASIRNVLSRAVQDVFPHFRLAPIRPSTDAAAKFLKVERLDRISNERDPLRLVSKSRGKPQIDVSTPVLAEVLRAFKEKSEGSGTGRLDGRYIQNLFSSPPYGWTKDTVRYLFSGLLRAGEVEFHIAGAEGPVRTPGPQAVESVRSTVAFNRIGVSLRDSKFPPEALERASKRLEVLFGDEVLPLEEHISRAVRIHISDLMEKIGSLPDRLRLLLLSGEDRARNLLSDMADLLKGDAGEATAVLGGVECGLPEEIKWARGVIEAFEGGAERDVTRSRAILKSLEELEQVFPGTSSKLISPIDIETMKDTLNSERFYENIPELRELTRKTTGAAKKQYQEEHKAFAEELKNALILLESEPEWTKLSDEDREEIAARFNMNLPESPENENVISDFQLLLFRRQGLPHLIQQSKAEMIQRLPEEPEAPDEEGENGEKVVDSNDLLPPGTISSNDDLESWLNSLRTTFRELLEKFTRIRIRKS